MKIIYITNVRLPTEKAHGLQIMKSCEAFASLGISLELVAPWRANKLKNDPFSFYKVKKNFKIKKLLSIDLFPVPFMSKRIAFYIQSLSFSILGTIYALLKKRSDIAFYSRDYATLFFLVLFGLNPVAEIHDYRSKKPKGPIAFILKRAKKIVVNSEGTLEALRSHYKFDSSKVIVVPNGVDIGFFDIKESRNEAREMLGMPEGFIMGYVGRLESAGTEKGVPLLIQVFNKIAEKHKESKLYIVGGPENLIDNYKKEYVDEVARDSVIFTGQVEYSKIPLYLRAIDAVVVPLSDNIHSRTTSPIKIFEFMAAGKIIITADIPGLKSVLNDRNSLMFKTGNSDDLADKIQQVISGKALFAKLADQAREDAKQYSWKRRAEKILNFIS